MKKRNILMIATLLLLTATGVKNEEKKYPNDSYLAATDGNRSEGW